MDGHHVDFPILTVLVLVPASARSPSRAVSKRRPELVKLVALLVSVVHRRRSRSGCCRVRHGDAGFQFVAAPVDRAWGISWHLGVDGISLFLVVLTGVLFPLAIVGVDPHHDQKPYLAWMLLLEAGVMGSFLSLDLFLFFVFFEIVLVPMYFLIGGWGYENRVYAATKFFLYTMFGSAFMLVGIIATAVLAQRQRRRPDHVRPRRDRRARRLRRDHRAVAVLRLRDRVRRQGADVPAAHVAARRAHPGADGRLGDPRRRDAEARHVRPPALRRVPVPGGGALGPAAVPHARRHRHHLRRDRGDDAEGPQAARRLLVGRPPRLHRARHVRHHQPALSRRRAADDQPRPVDRRAVPPRRDDLRAPAHPRDRRR